MDLVADVVGQVGVALAAVGAFMLAMALIARPFLGRRPSDRPLLDISKRNPSEASFVLLWRQRRWAAWVLAVGCALMVPPVIYWAVTGT